MSQDIALQIAAAEELLAKQKISPEHIAYFRTLAPALAEKLIGGLAASYKKLLDIAKKNGAANPDAIQYAKFGFGVKADVTNPKIVKADTSFTFNEPHRLRDGIMEELEQTKLNFNQGDGSNADLNPPDDEDDDNTPPPSAGGTIVKPVEASKPARGKKGKKK